MDTKNHLIAETKTRSGYEARILEEDEKDLWDDVLRCSDTGSVFHHFTWLKAAAKHSSTRLFPIICEKRGEGPVCLLPVFAKRQGPFMLIQSPPPGCAIPYLGPAFLTKSGRQNRIEFERREIIVTVEAYLKQRIGYDFLRIVGTPELVDVRPFTWHGFDARPNYTYRFPLTMGDGRERNGFDKRVKKRIKTALAYDQVYPLSENGKTLDQFRECVGERYSSQEMEFKPSIGYLREVVDGLGRNTLDLRGFCTKDRFLTGVLFAKFKENWIGWIGGAKPPEGYDGLVDLIHWNVIEEASRAGFKCYERVGANTPHLCQNKSKYNLRPQVYFELTRGSLMAKNAFRLYQWTRRGGRREDKE